MRASDSRRLELRAYVQNSSKSVAELATELGVSQTTVRRWRAPQSPRRSSSSSLSAEASERLVCELHTRAKLSADDITGIMQRCVSTELSRSDIDACLQRGGLVPPRPAPELQAAGAADPAQSCFALIQSPTPTSGKRWDFIGADKEVHLEQANGVVIDHVVPAEPATRAVSDAGRNDRATGFANGLDQQASTRASRDGDSGGLTRGYQGPARRFVEHAANHGAQPASPASQPQGQQSAARRKPITLPMLPIRHGSDCAGERPGASQRRSIGNIGRYTLALWLLGAVVYAASTQAFVRASEVFAQKDQTAGTSAKKPAAAKPTATKPTVAPRPNPTDERTARVKVPTPVANMEATPHTLLAKQQAAALTPSNANASATIDAGADADGKWVEVSGTGVNMRAGPSSGTRVVTVPSLGSRLRIVSHDGSWLEVLDPETGQKGWIHRKYAKPSASSGDKQGDAPSATTGARQETQF
jgi:transposase